MEKSVQNKKQSIDSLARIVADMGMLYQIVQSIEEYSDEYHAFVGDPVVNEMQMVKSLLYKSIKSLSSVADQVEKKVDQVLCGTAAFPEYRILSIDRRLIAGETKKAYILELPNSSLEPETFFVPKSMTSPNEDSERIDFRYYPDFSVVLMPKGTKEETATKVPVQYLVHIVESINKALISDDQNERNPETETRFGSIGPEEISKEEVMVL